MLTWDRKVRPKLMRVKEKEICPKASTPHRRSTTWRPTPSTSMAQRLETIRLIPAPALRRHSAAPRANRSPAPRNSPRILAHRYKEPRPADPM